MGDSVDSFTSLIFSFERWELEVKKVLMFQEQRQQHQLLPTLSGAFLPTDPDTEKKATESCN